MYGVRVFGGSAISPVGLNTPRGYGYFARWAQYASRLRLFRPLGSIRLAATAISPVGLNTPPRCAPPPAPAPRGGDGRKLRLDGAESKPHGMGYIKLRLGGAESKPHGTGYIKLRLGGAESKPHVIRVNRCVIRANRRVIRANRRVMRANREKTINTEN